MIDLSTKNKKFMTVKMADGTEIFVLPPKKKLLNQINLLKSDPENTDAMYDVLGAVLSNNMQGKVIPQEVIEDFDIVDIQAIMEGYGQFLDGIKNSPN